MPIINADAKSLEWVTAVYLSQDPIGIKELLDEEDIHANNQQAFILPSRHIAKIYLFRLIFGGSAPGYSNDADFADVPTGGLRREVFWQGVIDRTYDKYKGLGAWHNKIVGEVEREGHLVMPTGRVYTFTRYNGMFKRPEILNYPVQGLGADLLSIIRVSLKKRMKKLGLRSLFIATIHDSIMIDALPDEVQTICKLIYDVFADMPKNFLKLFGVEFNLPLRVEIQVGNTWGEMVDIDKEMLYAN